MQLVSARGLWFSECIINVYGFAAGPLPPSLTEPFDARPGEVQRNSPIPLITSPAHPPTRSLFPSSAPAPCVIPLLPLPLLQS